MVTFRKLRSTDVESLCGDIRDSCLLDDSSDDLNALVQQYGNTLSLILDKHAPIKQRHVIVHPSTPWYNQDVALYKNRRRRLDRKWRLSRLECDRKNYVNQCLVVNNLIHTLKPNYYKEIIQERSGDQNLLQKETVKHYPPAPDTSTLPNSFTDNFTCKISKVRSAFAAKRVHPSHIDVISPGSCSEFTNFHSVLKISFKLLPVSYR